jgi:hypothetical protein
MKRYFLGLFLFGIAGLSFSLEVQIPLYFVHANNFLSGTMSGTYNNRTIVERTHDENVFGIGGGIGADFYFKKRHWFGDGIYFRFNYYNPYHVKTSNTKVKTIISSSISFDDSERDIDNSYSFDIAVGHILRFKYKSFEFPLVLALMFPRVSKIDLESEELGREGIIGVGILFDVGARYFFTDRFFATLGGRYEIGFASGGFPDAEFPEGANISDTFSSSQIVAGYIGIGTKL